MAEPSAIPGAVPIAFSALPIRANEIMSSDSSLLAVHARLAKLVGLSVAHCHAAPSLFQAPSAAEILPICLFASAANSGMSKSELLEPISAIPRKATATSFAASPVTTEAIPAPARGNRDRKFAFSELMKF